MAIAGALFGGEPQLGSDIYTLQRDQTLAFMRMYDQPITDGIRRLARDGIGIEPQRHLCA